MSKPQSRGPQGPGPASTPRSPANTGAVIPLIRERAGSNETRSRPEVKMPEVGVESYRETMDAVGRLAGRVAHHLNNLLTVVEGNAAFLMEAQRDRRFESELRAIRTACARAGGLTARLLAVGGCRRARPRVVNLPCLVSRMDLGRLFGDEVVFCTDLPTVPCGVLIDPDHLEEVIHVLVTNAREAVGTRGTVRVSVDHLEGRRGSGRPGRGWVQLEVADSGPGMDQDTLERIFQPFFSTRTSDEDRGLGLAVACGVVRQSGGTIRVASAPGRGTTVRVLLPAFAPVSAWSPDDGNLDNGNMESVEA